MPGGSSDPQISQANEPWTVAEFGSFDSVAEVDAAFRAQRRQALLTFGVFLLVLFGALGATLIGGWWTEQAFFEGISPAFAGAGVVAYAAFGLLGVVAARRADRVERSMLGEIEDRK